MSFNCLKKLQFVTITFCQLQRARAQEVDDVEMFPEVQHDLDLRHQPHQLRLGDGRLAHLDGHHGVGLVLRDPNGLGTDLEKTVV